MTTINEILRTKVSGVWAGTYTVLTPGGQLLERFGSRQEGRMEGSTWTERVTYLREGQEPYEHYYHATVEGDEVTFHNSDMWGETSRVGSEAVIFSFGWRARPDERIIEITRPDGAYRSRVWQHFVGGELRKLTIIEERRVQGEEPVRWDPADRVL
ncbi:hypothetical protein [Nocardioides gansuensis]|uniref:hypothetical protein n=1 Tax=Nocardioides gansuensis TaxID=2138300 RepID=UPI0014032445|nr:hypothetical protein [Nocardioides gansuensis]